MPEVPDPAFRILLVCTGNICRSAFAERLGRAWLDEALGRDVTEIELVSAGTRAVVGSAMHPDTAVVLRGYGADPGDFRARQLTDQHPATADLILTMTRAHQKHLLDLVPKALPRAFTLREAAGLLPRLDGAPLSGTDLGERARALVTALTEARSWRPVGADDDVPDPVDRPVEAHEEAGELIAGALLPLLRRVVDLRRASSAGTEGEAATS
jgi:protein-tyrosine phosphatase